MRIDHVLWATDDLEATARRFAREHELPVRYAEGRPPGVRAVGLRSGAVIR